MLLVETYLSESSGKGLGLFSKKFIPKDTLIWQFAEGLDIKIHKEKCKLLNGVQKKFIDTYFWREGDYLYSSCDHSIFQNHSDNPNCIGLDEDKIIAARDINADDEILTCYQSFDDDFETYKNILINDKI
jgi:SET domain-containing protein